MMRALGERGSARKRPGLVDGILGRIATTLAETLVARLEPVVAEAVERGLARSGRVVAAPCSGDGHARSDAAGGDGAPVSAGSVTERMGSVAEPERGIASGTARVVRVEEGTPSTLRSNDHALQGTA